MQPSSKPTTPSGQPSMKPSMQPSSQPTRNPSSQPTSQPSQPSSHPSSNPTSQPSTSALRIEKSVYSRAPVVAAKKVYYGDPTPFPSFLATMPPTVATDLACITVTIETTIAKTNWDKEDVVRAMKEAVSVSFEVPINTVSVNYTDDSCQASVTFNPFGESIVSRRTLSMNLPDIPSFTNSALSRISPFYALVNDMSKQMKFSILIQIPGNYFKLI
jgi:hypothetical protein